MGVQSDNCHFAVMVGAAPGSEPAALALRFVAAAQKAGHEVAQVFFFHDAVAVLGEPEAAALWTRLQRPVDLIACVAALERREIVPEPPAGFRVAGLAQWLDASLSADRVVRFTDRG